MSTGSIVVVGGTGAVGRELVGLLAGGPDEVVVVGRNGDRAAAVAAAAAARSRARVSARRADVTVAADRRAALAGATIVVTCVERANVEVARAALDEGAHVVDVSASADVLAAIASLDDLARWHGRSAVLSVGLAPGLTNLLARACVERLPDAARVDITVLVGLGERHGADAIRWTLDALTAAPATHPTRTEPTRTDPAGTDRAGPRHAGAGPRRTGITRANPTGTGPTRTEPPRTDRAGAGPDDAGGDAGLAARDARVAIPGFGERTAHPFPFADQHVLRASLGIPVTTRLCFDSRAVTAAAFALRPVLRRLARAPAARAAVMRALGGIHLGGDRYAVTVTATAADGRRATAHARGRRQSHATAVVTAHVVRRLRERGVPPGVHHVDGAVDVGKALVEVEAAGITVRRP